MNHLHFTGSKVPPGYAGIGVVLGPGYFKVALISWEIVACWLDHSLRLHEFI